MGARRQGKGYIFRVLDYIQWNAKSSRYNTETSARSSIAGLTFGYFTFSSVRLILYEIRSGGCMDRFSGGQLNATPRNSHPLSWDGTMLLWVNVQGFSEGDRLAGVKRGGNQRYSSRCAPNALPVRPPSQEEDSVVHGTSLQTRPNEAAASTL